VKIVFPDHAWADYQHWIANDHTTLKRLNALIEQCRRAPFKGTGKPQPLKRLLQGWRSRRINHADRLVYRVAGTGEDQRLEIAQCRFHYE